MLAQMAQNYDKPFVYKGVEVRPAPQRVAQEWPNVAQIEVAQSKEEGQSVDLSFIGSAIASGIASIVAGAANGLETYREKRSKRQKWNALHNEVMADFKQDKPVQRKQKSDDKTTNIHVSGGVANITINNY